MKKIYLAVLSIMAAFSATAQDSDSPLTLSGYVDTYYFANFNGVSGQGANLGASGFERIFDHNANSFQVGLAQMMATYEAGPVTGVIDLVFGNHADLGNYGNVSGPLGGTGTALAIKQAFASWAMTDKVSLTAGQFGTNVGYEVIDAPVNYNYSLSNLFGNGPFYHTGIKLDVAPSDGFAFMVGINNGLDSKDDNNAAKGVMAQVYLAPTDGWDLYLNYFGTNEGTKDDPFTYTWFDITTSYQVTDKFLVGLNAVPYGAAKAGSADPLTWWGAALYLNSDFTDKFGLGLRAERFDNSEGGIYLINGDGAGAAVTSLTLTANINITDHLMLKPEIRMDSYSPSDNSSWLVDGDGAGTNSQTTAGAAMIFHF
ncbi:porin [Jiulongibacter sediminis]|uniref:Membrane protein n=1 Tax=Jiulongibacter sediminis TaxID=1605367 RepID=A0A0P7BEU1_9BACT|nr:porin [Jiulongibacter sediminis]KPM49317.1 membrane protein [Jiulongibacter sediminis]TBX26368.1 membrane protein [Jiulongibacter sediminis]